MRRRQDTARAPRVLYLPNEAEIGGENQQVGGRAAFAEMEADGTIGQLGIYSFLGEFYARNRNVEASHRELLERVRAFGPDVVFWSHPDDYPVSDALVKGIRNCGSSPLLVYHEGDPFDRFYKTLRNPQRTLYRHSDVFFTVGLGEGRRLFERIRPHKHLYHSPTYTERERFATPSPSGKLGSRFDAVMIGNIAKRLRVFRHPGSTERVQLARGLQRLFGDRFACFGSGWPNDVSTQGPLRHVQQADVIQSSRMSLMWEHFPGYTFYYSDRLPIALAAGVPFITSTRPGYDTLFPSVPGFFHVATVQDALDVAVYLRSLPLETIAEMGAGARAWVIDNLDACVIFRRLVAICIREYRERMRLGEGRHA
jgi:hypothetical protein